MRHPKRPTLFAVVSVGAIALAIIAGWLSTKIRSEANQQAKPLSASQFLSPVADIPLPGGSSRFDYQSLDTQTRRLYIAHLGAGKVVVFDTKTQKVIAEIEGLPGVHGVLAVPELDRLYASATDANKLTVIDATTLKIIASIPTGNYPDGIAYDPDDKRVFVSNQFGRSNTVVDVQTNQSVATIDLGGEVGNTQYDPLSNRIFAAVQTRNQLVAVNPKVNQVVDHYDVPGCDHPHGLLIDAANHLAFTACEDNAKLVTFSLKTMQVRSTHSVGDSPDVLAIDQNLHRLYVASESGVVSVFQEQGETLIKLEDILADSRAHSIAVDSQTHNVYLPLERVGNQPVLRILTAKLK